MDPFSLVGICVAALYPLFREGGPFRPGPNRPSEAPGPRIRNLQDFRRWVEQARALLQRGKVEEGRVLARDLLTAASRLSGWESPEAAAASELILEALLMNHQEKDGEALELAERILRLREAQLGPDDPRLVDPLLKLARVVSARGGPGATAHVRRAVALEESRGPEAGPPLGMRLAGIGQLSLSFGLVEEARELLARAIADRSHFSGEPSVLIVTLIRLAQLRMGEKRWPDARELLLEALPLSEANHPANERLTGTITYLLGSTLLSQGEFERAAELLRRTLEIEEPLLGPSHPDVALTLLALARATEQAGDRAAAIPLVERALTIQEASFGPDAAAVIEPLLLLGRVCFEAGEPARSRTALSRLLNLQEHQVGPEDPSLVTTLTNLSIVAEALRDENEARRMIERALAVGETAWGADSAELGPLLETLGRLQWLAGDLESCRATNERILGVYRRELGHRHPVVAGKLRELAVIAMRDGDPAGASRRLEEALTVLERSSTAQGPIVEQIVRDLAQVPPPPIDAAAWDRMLQRARTLLIAGAGAPPAPQA